jgi:hypothetical protein
MGSIRRCAWSPIRRADMSAYDDEPLWWQARVGHIGSCRS